MKRYTVLFIATLLLAALACSTPPTPTGTPEPPTGTLTPTATENPAETPAATYTATAEPSATPTNEFDTPTPIAPGEIPDDAPELLLNPGAEGIYHQCITEDCPPFTIYDCPSGNCASFWIDYFCNDTGLDPNGFRYAPRKCDVPLMCQPGQTTGCNAPETMATFESKEAAIWVDPYRVNSGERAIQQFCRGRNCWGGIYQVVDTSNAAYCLATGWAEGWFAAGPRSNAEGNPNYRSDNRTLDDRRNGHAQIVAFLDGGPPYFFDQNGQQLPLSRQVVDSNMVVSADFGYESGLYDITQKGTQIYFYFTPTGPQTTVAYEWYNLWPGAFNEVYFDDLSVRCAPLPGGASVDVAPQSLVSEGDVGMFDLTALIELLQRLLEFVPEVAVFAPVIVAIIGALKEKGWLTDGYAGLVQGGLNLVAWLLIAFLPGEYANKMGDVANVLVWLLPALIGILANMAITKGVYHLFGWFEMPVLGFSHPKAGSPARP